MKTRRIREGEIIATDGDLYPYFSREGIGQGQWEGFVLCDGRNGTPNLNTEGQIFVQKQGKGKQMNQYENENLSPEELEEIRFQGVAGMISGGVVIIIAAILWLCL